MKGKIFENIFWLLLAFLYICFFKYENTVVFLDVGQGDAILIQNGSTQLLVDGGPDNKVMYELQKYMPFYDKKIEYILLTHPHDDHLVGLLELLNRYEVENILYYPVCYENENYKYMLQEYNNLKVVSSSDTIRLKDIEIEVVWPVLNQEIGECVSSFDGNINNDSLVLSFTYLKKRFLLMGDIEEEVERVLIREKLVEGTYDVLKAGHHCSNTSNSETFLKTIFPALVICSLGEGNTFGHPGSETLKNFSKLNVQYLITSEEGNIQIK